MIVALGNFGATASRYREPDASWIAQWKTVALAEDLDACSFRPRTKPSRRGCCLGNVFGRFAEVNARMIRASWCVALLAGLCHVPWCPAQSIGVTASGTKSYFSEPTNTSITATNGIDIGLRAGAPIGKHGLILIEFGHGRTDLKEQEVFPSVSSPAGYAITRSSSMARNHVDALIGREVFMRRRIALHVLSGIRVVGWAGYDAVETQQPSGTVTHYKRRPSEWRSDIGLILSGRITWNISQRISLALEPHAFGVMRDGSASYARPGYSPRPSLNWNIGTRGAVEFRIVKKPPS